MVLCISVEEVASTWICSRDNGGGVTILYRAGFGGIDVEGLYMLYDLPRFVVALAVQVRGLNCVAKHGVVVGGRLGGRGCKN